MLTDFSAQTMQDCEIDGIARFECLHDYGVAVTAEKTNMMTVTKSSVQNMLAHQDLLSKWLCFHR